MDAVAYLLGLKPDWASATRLLSDNMFCQRLMMIDKVGQPPPLPQWLPDVGT